MPRRRKKPRLGTTANAQTLTALESLKVTNGHVPWR